MAQNYRSILTLLTLLPIFTPVEAKPEHPIQIPNTQRTPIFDGACKEAEWQNAKRIELPASTEIYLMHDEHTLYVCAKGKAEDYTVIDIYIENDETGFLHNLHASAQLAERIASNREWGESTFWNLQDWGGFWVPFTGTEDTDNGSRTTFLKGSDREIQILRRKFPGQKWNMMISVSGVHHEGEYGASFSYPSDAKDTDTSTWSQFQFSE